MWVLKDESGKVYYLKPSQPFIIGRNHGDLILKSDGSISRSHAKIQVSTHPEKCTVSDTKSKYGTFLVNKDSEVIQQLKGIYIARANDRIRFGLQTSILTLTYLNFVVVMSSLTPEDKKELLEIIEVVGGRVLPDWDDNCTHLTVSTTKLTAKLSCSLAAGVPIVTIDYWRSVKNAKAKGNPTPDPKDFCPALEDSMLVQSNKTSLLPSSSRKSIFKDLLFIHFRENQLKVYEKMIELAGGSSVFYGNRSFDKKLLSHPNSRVVLYNDDNSQDEPHNVPDVATVQSYLKKKQRRMIPDTEIPLAILYSSAQQCCNPEFSYKSLLKSGMGRKGVVEEGETLVADTQEGEGQFGRGKRIVPESLVIPETESIGAGDSQRFRNEGKKSSIGSITKEESIEDSRGRNERKRCRNSEDGETGEKEKRARIECLPSKTDKELSHRLFSCIKSNKVPAKPMFDDSDDDFEEVPLKKTTNVEKILGKSCLDISEKKMIANDKTIGRQIDEKNGKKNQIDAETIKTSVKIKDNDTSNDIDVHKDSLPKKNEKHPKFLEESDDEQMEMVNEPIEGGIDRDDDDVEWRKNEVNEKSRMELLREIVEDGESMESSFLRPEIFSGKYIGKKFKKFQPKVSERCPIEWKRGL